MMQKLHAVCRIECVIIGQQVAAQFLQQAIGEMMWGNLANGLLAK